MNDGKIDLSSLLTSEESKQRKQLRRTCETLNQQLVKEGVVNEIGSMKRSEAIKSQLAEAEQALREFEDGLHARHPEMALKRIAKTATLEDVGRVLPEDTALLEYATITTARTDETVLFVVTRHNGTPQLYVHRIALGRFEIRPHVEALRMDCSDPRKAYASQAADMYRLLIKPAEAELHGAKKLIICPDGPLWDVPFAALLKEGTGFSGPAKRHHFLIEDYELNYAFSATGANAALSVRSAADRQKPAKTMLAFADAAFGDETIWR